jgi:hypothetical protein
VIAHRVALALVSTLSAFGVGVNATRAQAPAPTLPEIRFEAIRPFGIGDVQAVEFRDVAGKRTRVVEESLAVSKRDGRQHIEEVTLLTTARWVLVTESTRTETDESTRRATGRLVDVRNTITLYDRFGAVRFTAEVECTPVALSESGRSLCLLTAPEYWEGPPALEKLSPATDHLTVFSRRGAVLREIDEPRWTVRNPTISPAGNWIAYAKQLRGLENQVVLWDLRTDRRVETPVTRDRGLLTYRAVTNKGDLITFQDAVTKRPDGTWAKERSPSRVLRKMAPE